MLMKTLVRSLNATFATPVTHLPDEIQHAIEQFLDANENTIDEYDASRLHDDLLCTYETYVDSTQDKLAPFICALRMLRPVMREQQLAEWWELVIRPAVDSVGHKREVIDEAREFLLAVLVFDAERDSAGDKARVSRHFLTRLLDSYRRRTKIPPAAAEETITPESEFIAHELESVLVAFGRRKPKELLVALDELLVRKDDRAQVLALLCAFVRVQPPHLYLVLETSLIQHLYKCLMIDTSSTVVYLALTNLIMFLPHITSALVGLMPKLFLVYARLLCWSRIEPSSPEQYQNEAPEEVEDIAWEKLEGTNQDNSEPAPEIMHFFTFLYGLFPLNLMSFIRKPRKFLKGINFPKADEFDLPQDYIRAQTEKYRENHLLHPHFFTMQIEDELAENRWVKTDAADLVMECMSLCVATPSLNDPGPPPKSKLPALPKTLDQQLPPSEPLLMADDDSTIANDTYSPSELKSNSSWRNTHSTAITQYTSNEPLPIQKFSNPASRSSRAASPASRGQDTAGCDSPTLPPVENVPDLPAKIPEISKSLNFPIPPPSEPTSPTLEEFGRKLSQRRKSPKYLRRPEDQSQIATLQRELMLLRNDLHFERYLKLQHLSHIGQLQRKHIKEATVEAETQNLINANKALRAKLEKANKLMEQLKKQQGDSRARSKKWEGDLSTKVKFLREEQKSWVTEEEALRHELTKYQRDCEELRTIVVQRESAKVRAEQHLQSLQADLSELDALRHEVDSLQSRLREYELRELDFEQAKEDKELLRADLDSALLKLNHKDAELERTRKVYEHKLLDMERRLNHVKTYEMQAADGRLPDSVQAMLDSALAASNSRIDRMRKAHTKLLNRYNDLQARYYELGGDFDHPTGQPQMQQEPDRTVHAFDRRPSHMSGGGGSGPLMFNSNYRRPHAFSDPIQDEEEYMAESPTGYHSSGMSSGPNSFPNRPTRYESLTNRQNPAFSDNEYMNDMPAQQHEYGGPLHEANTGSFRALQHQHQHQLAPSTSHNAPSETVHSSNRSAFSIESGSSNSKSEKNKEKITPKSDVRVYGRGECSQATSLLLNSRVSLSLFLFPSYISALLRIPRGPSRSPLACMSSAPPSISHGP
ncbi:Hamartin protein-domain-containing protein [Lineolata rhizophorae]|uniref:Hamartin protein-domain-containing protein n=1 Tax=Lineolata rhizophorae TaxID=578093 RepID=A0A6A6P523_9PEZI|nr:Hamartin protein-domain-containing protein [Lineolata rhizophorae]